MGNRNVNLERYEKNISIMHYNSRGYRMDFPHLHDGYEIHLNLAVNNTMYIEDKIYKLDYGTVTIINDMEVHRNFISEEEQYERFIVSFKPEYIMHFERKDGRLLEAFINRPEGFLHAIKLEETELEQFVKLLKKLYYYCNNDMYGKEYYEVITLIEILIFISEIYSNQALEVNVKRSEQYIKIKEILTYIRGNLDKDLSLDTLACIFYMSKSHIAHTFKMALGITTNEYITLVRIMKAKQLLKQGVAVGKVGDMVGFKNQSHFIRVFKKHMGITPKQYSKI